MINTMDFISVSQFLVFCGIDKLWYPNSWYSWAIQQKFEPLFLVLVCESSDLGLSFCFVWIFYNLFTSAYINLVSEHVGVARSIETVKGGRLWSIVWSLSLFFQFLVSCRISKFWYFNSQYSSWIYWYSCASQQI